MYTRSSRDYAKILDLLLFSFWNIIYLILLNFFQVKGVAGDSHLGGEDFDNRVLDFLADEFAFKHGKDIGSNKRLVW